MHKCASISLSSSFVNSFRPNLLFLISVISLIKLIFQESSPALAWYLSSLISCLVTSSKLSFSVSKRIFLTFKPVIDPTSLFTYFKICLGTVFLDFLICSRKPRKRSIRTNFRCCAPETSSMRQRWRSYIILTAVFQVFSNMTASLQNKSHIGLLVKSKL